MHTPNPLFVQSKCAQRTLSFTIAHARDAHVDTEARNKPTQRKHPRIRHDDDGTRQVIIKPSKSKHHFKCSAHCVAHPPSAHRADNSTSRRAIAVTSACTCVCLAHYRHALKLSQGMIVDFEPVVKENL